MPRCRCSAAVLLIVAAAPPPILLKRGSPAPAPVLATPRYQVHRTSRSLIASTGVDSEWAHTREATAANPAVAHLNADLWYRLCLLPLAHEFIYRTPALCSNASYSQANVPVTIVLSSKVRRDCLRFAKTGALGPVLTLK